MKNAMKKATEAAQKAKASVLGKDKGGKEIIVELGLAGIAVALLIVYRGEINTLVTGIMSQATTAIQGLFAI